MDPENHREKRVCAVVVVYNPGGEVIDNIKVVSEEFSEVVVVDNGSESNFRAALAAFTRVTWLAQNQNVGVAAALNIGVRFAASRGYDWVATFDQDSRPNNGFGEELWQTHLRFPQCALVGSCISEGELGSKHYRWLSRNRRFPWIFCRVACGEGDIVNVTMAITSGSMLSVDAWNRLGGFDERLFIDYVDTDYCLRLRKAGGSIAVSANAVLNHHLGARRSAKALGRDFRPTFHAPFRHRYIARNRIWMFRRHFSDIHWLIFDFTAATYNLFRVVVFEDRRAEKIAAMVRGTVDGILGKSGKIEA